MNNVVSKSHVDNPFAEKQAALFAEWLITDHPHAEEITQYLMLHFDYFYELGRKGVNKNE